MLTKHFLSMENEEKNKNSDNRSVDDIRKEIKLLEENIAEKQYNCLHRDGYTVKLDNIVKSVIKICDKCGKNIGYPSSGELKKNGFMK